MHGNNLQSSPRSSGILSESAKDCSQCVRLHFPLINKYRWLQQLNLKLQPSLEEEQENKLFFRYFKFKSAKPNFLPG